MRPISDLAQTIALNDTPRTSDDSKTGLSSHSEKHSTIKLLKVERSEVNRPDASMKSKKIELPQNFSNFFPIEQKNVRISSRMFHHFVRLDELNNFCVGCFSVKPVLDRVLGAGVRACPDPPNHVALNS